MKIIVDTMGSDKGSKELIKGALDAINEWGIEVIFVGNKQEIQEALNEFQYEGDKIEIIPTSEVIEHDDDPVMSIRRKRNSSMVVASQLLKDSKADGLISTGNTGALLAAGLFIVGRIDGIERPAISVIHPTKKGFSLLLDAGANADCKSEYLLQFAKMGYVYMDKVMNIDNPKVGLINVGVEKGKGNKLTKDTFTLLEKSDINFIGNIEARDIPFGDADVLVTDGFTGNIVLKMMEGMAIFMKDMLKAKFEKNIKTKLSALLIKNEAYELKETLDYREYGGAPLLGIKKPIVKAHGSSDAFAFKNGIKQLIDFIEKDIINIIEYEINKEEK